MEDREREEGREREPILYRNKTTIQTKTMVFTQ